MAYDKSKDKEIIQSDIDGLKISVFSYNEGEKKLQIGPRTYEKKNGGTGYSKAGRLNLDEAEKLMEILPNLISEMKSQ